MDGKNTHRLDENPLEAKFAELWGKDYKYRDTLNYLLSERVNEPTHVNEHDQEVAATVIQWLGSPVGQCFLEEALGIEVRRLLPEDRHPKYD